MSVDVLDQLRCFSHEADELRQEPLAQTGWDNSYTLNFDRTRGLSSALRQPNETLLRSLLLTLRKFVSEGEPVFLNRIYNVCEQHITNEEMRHLLRHAREKWKQAQKSGGMKLVYNGRDLTPEHVADLWINGHYFHSEPEKLRELREIVVFGLDRVTFVTFVGDTLRQVLYVDNVVRHALRDGCVRL